MATFISISPAETEEFARRFAKEIMPGDLLALKGELGAGKTQFVKGLVAGLGSDAVVASPTFTIIHEYRGGKLPLAHVDLYRLESANGIGLEDYLGGEWVTVIEWAEKIELPEGTLKIHLAIEDENTRRIED